MKYAFIDELSLVLFQSVLLAAKDMANSGLIHITNIHKESETAKDLIDLIVFRRVK